MTRACAALLLLLGCAACSDSAPREHLAKGRARYEALVAQGKSPRDKGFDEVLAELARVPASSSSYEEAQRLRAAVETARVPAPPRPLAWDAGTPGHDHGGTSP